MHATAWFFSTKISLGDAILCCVWLKASNNFIGGVNNSIIINGCVLSDFSIDHSPADYWLKNFKDVFVTESLAFLPHHQPGFDCEINLKADAVPPLWCSKHHTNFQVFFFSYFLLLFLYFFSLSFFLLYPLRYPQILLKNHNLRQNLLEDTACGIFIPHPDQKL